MQNITKLTYTVAELSAKDCREIILLAHPVESRLVGIQIMHATNTVKALKEQITINNSKISAGSYKIHTTAMPSSLS